MGQTVIEINGVKYDAHTGSVVVKSPTVAVAQKHNGLNIDGVVSTHKFAPAPPPVKATAFKPTLGRKVHDVTMLHHKHASKSKTLMRTAVKKPGGVHIAKQTQILTQSSSIRHSESYSTAMSSGDRLNKAVNTPTHSTVSRFSAVPHTKLQPTMTHMVVVVPKASPIVTPNAPPVVHSPHKHSAADFVNAQLAKNSNMEAESPFKKQPLRKRAFSAFKGNKLKSLSASVLAIALLTGLIVYQNLPTLSLVLANRNAGISAKIPKGIPSNFAINRSIDATKGQVTLLFDSRTDERNFTITQQTSDLSSGQLEEAIASSNNKTYQSYDSNGIKLFITGPGSADWVDGKMRYNLSGNSGLSSEQLASIARSL